MMIIWLFLLIGLFFFMSRQLHGHNQRGSKDHRHNYTSEQDSALEILKRRYAAGELSLEDYKVMAEEIRGY